MCDPCDAAITVTVRDIRRFRWKKVIFFSLLSLVFLLPILLSGLRREAIDLPVVTSPTGDIGCCIVTLTGSGTPGSEVFLVLNDNNIGQVTVDETGAWSFSTSPLEPGTYTVLAYVVDKHGRRHQATRTIQFTVLPPAEPPTVTLATEELKPGRIPLSGTAEPGTSLSIELNGEQIGEVQADDQGEWSFTMEGVQAGDHVVRVWAVDGSNTQHTASRALSFSIANQTWPPVITPPEGELDPAEITIQGSGTPGTTVELVRDGVTIAQATVDDNGLWSVKTDVSSYITSFQAIGYTSDGQEIGRSEVLRLRVPAAAELVPIGEPCLTDIVPDDDGGVTATFSWAGRGEPGTLLSLEGTAELEQTLEIDASGNWSISRKVHLEPGTYNLIARMKDRQGTLLDSSEPRQVLIELPPPQPAEEQPAADAEPLVEELVVKHQEPAEVPPPPKRTDAGKHLQQSLDELLTGQKIGFALSAAKLTDNGKKLLEAIAEILRQYPDIPVEISGHTDSTGDRRANQLLSEQRAEAVRQYLVSLGISADRLRAVGYGDSKPLVDNSTLENRRTNRRVEFRVLEKQND